MAKYADGFVIVVPKKNFKDYVKIAKAAGKVWMEYGALEYRETVGEDLKVKVGVPFPKLAKTKKGEVVVFSWIVYKSRAHRDKVNAKVMKDKRILNMMHVEDVFDCTRMSYGGFDVFVDKVR